MKYNKKVLPNGLTVLSVPSREAESVVVDVFVKTGSRSETDKQAGISHFLEHFLFKGTEKYPTAMAINEIVDGIGGDMNASTSKESTQFYIKARNKHFALIMDILADMIQRPLFDPVESEKEKGVIVEEMNMRNDSPPTMVDELLDNIMWPGQTLGRDIIGTKKSVTSLNPSDFRKYMQQHYQPGNMVLGISGHYSEQELDKLVKQYWSGLPKKRGGGWSRVNGSHQRAKAKVEFKETEQAHLALGYTGFPLEDKRNTALAILSAVLGGGMSSRLWDEIREKRGLAYYVRCGTSTYRDVGQVCVSAGVQLEKTGDAVKIILQELHTVAEKSISPKEIAKAKEYLKGRIALALEDNQTKLDWYLEQVAFKKKVYSPDQVFAKLNQVNASDVLSVAHTVFKKSRPALAVVGPYKNSKNFEKLLK